MYDEAIEILIVKIGETESLPTAWLMLFDLYARTEKRQQYEALAAGFHAQFNAITPNWEDLKTEGLKRIDDYPVVLNKITHSWGLPAWVA